jgi:DNA sulfur modification protein DndD
LILDKIVIENYGVFGGRQEVILTPNEGKPIILLGGMNGSGKTTFLDAIQLAFYGNRARISNRGKLTYKEYLRESIHHKSNLHDGAGISVGFRRNIQGEMRNYELHRYWRETELGIEETLRVCCDGKYDELLTENWEESIEAYLSSGISHLFFFDGEQIMELAEGGHTAEILGTAIQSLLGLELVDRLESDLKIFERRKKSVDINSESAQRSSHAQKEVQEADHEVEKIAILEGNLVNEVGRLAKDLQHKEEIFRQEGGELFLRRKELEAALDTLRTERSAIEIKYRELISGALPLSMVKDLLEKAEAVAHRENEIHRAREFLNVLIVRDAKTISSLESSGLDLKTISLITHILEEDRNRRSLISGELIIFDSDYSLADRLAEMRKKIIPTIEHQAKEYSIKINMLNEKIVRIEGELERVPNEERITEIQNKLKAAFSAHEEKSAELQAIRVRRTTLHQLRLAAEARLNKIEDEEADSKFAEDDRLRILKHSQRVRETLRQFRIEIIRNHASHIEKLVLESFHNLLYKKELVNRITIDPETFETKLIQSDGLQLPFERLSAGEKQLLATSLLWGLARASGRPVPTIIDTPLGRLDSSHRHFLVERYFPNASHQVLLLSTDEEIVGAYYDSLSPFISKMYLFQYDNEFNKTQIRRGYFPEQHEATS